MLPRRVESTSSAFWLPGAACRGTAQGLTRPGAPICITLFYIYAALSSGHFCYLVTAGGGSPRAIEPAAPFLGPPSSKNILHISYLCGFGKSAVYKLCRPHGNFLVTVDKNSKHTGKTSVGPKVGPCWHHDHLPPQHPEQLE